MRARKRVRNASTCECSTNDAERGNGTYLKRGVQRARRDARERGAALLRAHELGLGPLHSIKESVRSAHLRRQRRGIGRCDAHSRTERVVQRAEKNSRLGHDSARHVIVRPRH